MEFKIATEDFNHALEKIAQDFYITAPVRLPGTGMYSETDVIGYGEVKTAEEIVFDKKSDYSFKEAYLPITQTLFYFTEDQWTEPATREKSAFVFLRSCDIHSVQVFDDIYLHNGAEDIYFQKLRENMKLILIGCEKNFENCFCVSMGTNTTDHYDAYIKVEGDTVFVNIKDPTLEKYFEHAQKEDATVAPCFVTENDVKVTIPDQLSLDVMDSTMWEEYASRCIACGRCNFVCHTCTCYSMQDIFYQDNPNAGERRRVWAACHVQGFTDMAGGHAYRQNIGQRMRFKALHKVYDYKKRWGYHMCTGCGRCDDVCPEYISFSNCINKLGAGMEEVNQNGK